ncbi:MAG TPA: helix-turn-helix domain-containing protein [Actinomycetota bacterium]|nr:helix-turn-helix domain-containing protein [Actinomycetota bacterium]
MRPFDDDRTQAIGRVFSDAAAVLTIDEVAARFGMTLSEAVRAMSDLEAIGVVRRIGDEYVPGIGAATAS